MSHLAERKEKNCLNCGTMVQGRYCHICGQENIEPKESFWHLVQHFFYDITHFDGKLLHSFKYLLTRPGFLPAEYMRGRRATYLNPIRMYVFVSAVFFLLFFSFLHMEGTHVSISTINGKTIEQIDAMDSTRFAEFTADINKEDGRPALPMTRQQFKEYTDTILNTTGIKFTGRQYASVKEYDSLLAAGVVHDSWIQRQAKRKMISWNVTYHNNGNEIMKAFTTTLLHTVPQMLFLSLPLVALILQLLYVRRRKEFFYTGHAIFTIYYYIFLFFGLLVFFTIRKINGELDSGLLTFIETMTWIGMLAYGYVAMKKFYGQGWGKTLLKFILLTLLSFIVIGILFLFFILFSLYKI